MKMGQETFKQKHMPLAAGKGVSREREAAPGRLERRPVAHCYAFVQPEIPGTFDELLLVLPGNRPVGSGPDLGSVLPKMFPEHGIDTVEAPLQIESEPVGKKSPVDDPAGLDHRIPARVP